MESAKFSNFSIEHILGCTSKGNRPSNLPTDNFAACAVAKIDGFHPSLVTGLSAYPGFYSAIFPPIYCSEKPYRQSPVYCDEGYSGYATANFYPMDFSTYCSKARQSSFSNQGSPPQQNYLTEIVNPRKRNSMRTMFTETQSQLLELLFSLTAYPAAEEREELARNTGLSQETVRVWFKNRRARRKRQNVTQNRTKSPCEKSKSGYMKNRGGARF